VSAWFVKKGMALHPTDEDSRKGMLRMGDGECVLVTIVRPRNTKFHRLYFAMCAAIGENCEPRRDAESIDLELRIRAGHYDVILVDGIECRVPKRIAFARLSADQWEALFPSLDLAAREHFGIGSDFEACAA
jgi:hypothetical protein